ncbi:MAG: hypothetical protein K0R27_2281 [Xanthobacteraceae bacterium]|jgi:hypothetical protein|nr:hypothetical protein [Xanthobacteraceae bacterium]
MAKSSVKKKRPSDGRPQQQYAALPYVRNENGTIEVLVMSSRETRRAVIPKGWPMRNRKSWKTAEIEARQEAGLIGEIGHRSIGEYRYWKRLDSSFVLVKVAVYPLRVTRQLTDWPEKHERVQKWLPPEDAAALVDETELGEIIVTFSQSIVPKPKAARRREGSAQPVA